jgi:hypothetical protein
MRLHVAGDRAIATQQRIRSRSFKFSETGKDCRNHRGVMRHEFDVMARVLQVDSRIFTVTSLVVLMGYHGSALAEFLDN